MNNKFDTYQAVNRENIEKQQRNSKRDELINILVPTLNKINSTE